MKWQPYSEMTLYSALSMFRLGQRKAAGQLLRSLRHYAKRLAIYPATPDYFTTSMPAMVLLDKDSAKRQKTRALFLHAQAEAGLGNPTKARELLARVRRQDPSHFGTVTLTPVLAMS